jgi:adhesin/invasin
MLPPQVTTLELEPIEDTNGAGSLHTVIATVKDQNGNPLSGRNVTFTVTGAHDTSGTATTGADGKATFSYVGTVAGDDTITATADSLSATAIKHWIPGPPGSISLTPTEDTNPVDTTHTVEALVEDAYGNPVSSIEVTFTVTGAHDTSGTATTGADGKATFSYVGTVAGDDTITAVAEGVEDTATAIKHWQKVENIILSPLVDTNTVGTTHEVTATVTDQDDNPVVGLPLTFVVTGANPVTKTVETDASGKAVLSYLGTKVGTDTIVASAKETTSNAVMKYWVAGEPQNIKLTPKSAVNAVSTTHDVTATVTDEYGNPLYDVDVTFLVNNDYKDTLATGANGEVPFSYTGPDTAGTDTIKAYVAENPSIEDTATKEWREPYLLQVTPTEDTNTVESTHTVTARVIDKDGLPVPNVNVDFQAVFSKDIGADTTETTTLVTDENGYASWNYTRSHDTLDATETASDTITVSLPSFPGVGTQTVIKHWYRPYIDEGSLQVTPLEDTNTVGEQHMVTATLVDQYGNPIVGQQVWFWVTGSNPTIPVVRTTDASGVALFWYSGLVSGDDTITAYAPGMGDTPPYTTGEDTDTVTKHWE